MAMQLDLQATPIGVGFSKSYIRIWNASYRKGPPPGAHANPPDAHVQLHLFAYVFKPVDEQQQPIDQKFLTVDWKDIASQPGDNFLAQCYAWLHTQEEFKDAEVV